jgi:hypothetical protein
MAVTIKFYDQFADLIGVAAAAEAVHLDSAAHMYHMLVTNAFVFLATETLRTQVTEELSTANGYTATDGVTAGEVLASPTWVEAAGVVTFDAADTTWSASGGSIVASDVVLFDTTPTSPLNPILFSVDFDGDQTAGDGTNFLIAWNGSGIFTSQFTDA